MTEYRLPQNPDDRATEVTEHIAHPPSWDCQQCLRHGRATRPESRS